MPLVDALRRRRREPPLLLELGKDLIQVTLRTADGQSLGLPSVNPQHAHGGLLALLAERRLRSGLEVRRLGLTLVDGDLEPGALDGRVEHREESLSG